MTVALLKDAIDGKQWDIFKSIVGTITKFSLIPVGILISRNHLDIIKYLYDNYNGVGQLNVQAAFLRACHYNNIEMVEYLVSRGANISSRDCMAFKAAINKENMDVAKYLLTLEPSMINTPFLIHEAIKAKSVKGVDFILERGIKWTENERINALRSANIEIVNVFIKYGLDIEKDVIPQYRSDSDIGMYYRRLQKLKTLSGNG